MQSADLVVFVLNILYDSLIQVYFLEHEKGKQKSKRSAREFSSHFHNLFTSYRSLATPASINSV